MGFSPSDSTPALRHDADAMTREFLSTVLQRLASVGQRTVAEGLGVSESTVSRMKEGELERLCRMLALLGLRLVPAEAKCHPPEYIQALKALAKIGLAAEERRGMGDTDSLKGLD